MIVTVNENARYLVVRSDGPCVCLLGREWSENGIRDRPTSVHIETTHSRKYCSNEYQLQSTTCEKWMEFYLPRETNQGAIAHFALTQNNRNLHSAVSM